MLKISSNLAARVLDSVFGQDCVLCGNPVRGPLACPACESRLPEDTEAEGAPGCDRVAAALAYRFPVDRMVQRFKFAGDLALGAWFGGRLAHRVRREPRPHLLVAMPLAAHRLRERGFNQAMELARIVGRELELPLARGVARVRHTSPQPGLDRAQRRRNLSNAFRVDGDLRGLSVAIVDDVLTTGATAGSLAQTLRAAGAGEVFLWVAARTPGPGTQ